MDMKTASVAASNVSRAEMLQAIKDYVIATRKVRIAFDLSPPQPELPMFEKNEDRDLLETLMNVEPADWNKYLGSLDVLQRVYEEVRLQIQFLDDRIEAQAQAGIAGPALDSWS